MSLIRVYTLFLSLLFLQQLGAAHLDGKIANAEGVELKLYYVSNFITNQKVIVDSCVVSDSGEYSFYVEPTEAKVYYVNVGLNNAQVILIPGQSMTINLPDYKPLGRREFLNPFFESDNVLLYNEEEKDINYYITEIEIKSTLLLDTTLRSSSPSYMAEKALDEMSLFTAQLTNSFAKNYSYYSEALFAQLANPENWDLAKQKYLRNHAPKINNPAFINLFLTEYGNSFLAVDGVFYDFVSDAIIDGKVTDNFINQLSTTMKIKNRTMAELVAVKGFYDAAIYAPTYERPIAQLMEQLENLITDEKVSELCSSTRTDLERLMEGAPAPPYDLLTLKGKKVPYALRRKHVLLGFINTTIYECQEHLETLEELRQIYKRDLEVVCVAVHQTPEELQRFLNNNKYENIYFSLAEKNDKILADYAVKVLPTYYLIGTDGQLAASPLSPPNEFMKADLEELIGY